MTREELEAIRARADAATAGPWAAMDNSVYTGRQWRDIVAGVRGIVYPSGFTRHSGGETETHYGVAISDENADFIAHARTDIPALLAEVERLRGAGEGQCPPNVCAVCYHRKDACAHCDKPTVTDAMVEAAAKGLAESDDEAWRYHSEATRQWYLRHARRALTAALGEAV
jgi:hypothetical protein